MSELFLIDLLSFQIGKLRVRVQGWWWGWYIDKVFLPVGVYDAGMIGIVD